MVSQCQHSFRAEFSLNGDYLTPRHFPAYTCTVEKISKKLRDALATRPESLRQIAEAVEMDHSQLSRFLRGERTITQDSIDKLGLYLGLELKPPAKKPRS